VRDHYYSAVLTSVLPLAEQISPFGHSLRSPCHQTGAPANNAATSSAASGLEK
jgi:hypothetical protein